MTQAQKLIEDILQVAHQDNGVSIFEIQDALKAVLKDVDEMVEDCRVKEPRELIGYYLQVSGLWQKTTKEAFETSTLHKTKINMEYWDESMEILRTTPNIQEAIREVESYL